MTVLFNHTIIAARDKHDSAAFFTRVFALPPAEPDGYFLVVHLDGGTMLQFAEPGIEFPPQHYAFLITEEDFDGLYGRLRHEGVPHWADPRRKLPEQHNNNHGGRGVYFTDPAGHFLEAMTRPYTY
ncbi:Glyoxalase-like domain-containing protein [Actinopolyspora xinjiangensis]|uniref:Glyoxalase-like domain-containing protein n=1 Tax=Actinopolyspora xinjiangensis TaxID=405564 RepID=A0A1H0QS27_9ACTN|nr:VOC family protein [Actinopolyspora xinjiangensis]SDP20161.1 Glyoxalase-like domain-containing protein [Actinopolyspora xinjiangensis]